MARKQLQNLTEPMYYILLSLIKPIHGYGIMKNIDQITNGRVQVGAGTMYALLSRFEKEEIVEQVNIKEGKKIYIITDKGINILKQEYTRLKTLVIDGENLLEGDDKNGANN